MRPKVLLVDDDKDLLEVYREILSQLPSNPEVFTTTSGARAIAMLEAEPFTLLVSDLNMPKMDGLQVLSIVRRKYPELRTVVLTSVMDEQFRSRCYGLGVDLFWHKPGSMEETKQFTECLESLLGREENGGGFRGVQSKSLVDLIQLECISQNSTMLKITNGPLTGRIWIQGGEVLDAVTDELSGEPAFHRILSWKAGTFESLPADPARERTIFNSYQGLLLASAQAQDEAQNRRDGGQESTDGNSPQAHFPGVEFILALKPSDDKAKKDPVFEARGLDNPLPVAKWTRETIEQLSSLGERLRAGPLGHLEGYGKQGHVSLAAGQERDFCIGWEREFSTGDIYESTKKVTALWVS